MARVINLSIDEGLELSGCNNIVVVVPIGSIEFHGGKLPLGTDNFIADKITDYCIHKCDTDKCIVKTPVLPIGLSHEWLNKPGTITLSTETMILLLRDVISSIKRTIKPWRIIIVNGHGGNYYILKTIVKEHNVLEALPKIYLVDIWRIAEEYGLNYCHACPFEAELLNRLTGWSFEGVNRRVHRRELLEEYIAGYDGEVRISVDEFIDVICGLICGFIG